MILESKSLKDYLASSHYINYDNPRVKIQAEELAANCKTKTEIAENIYKFVRDKIQHSVDIQNHKVNITASEVLTEGHGICYAKSHLFAALLRSQGIPTGFCYQRLTIGMTPDTGYCIHALNAVYLDEIERWIRLDARGNKEGVNAQFSIEEECLAFPVRTEYDESDYEMIYVEPADVIIKTLESSNDAIKMYFNELPTKL